eukprot:SAG31_NODE_4978_length_2823_cov_1.544420_2_plen_107_part_00
MLPWPWGWIFHRCRRSWQSEFKDECPSWLCRSGASMPISLERKQHTHQGTQRDKGLAASASAFHLESNELYRFRVASAGYGTRKRYCDKLQNHVAADLPLVTLGAE